METLHKQGNIISDPDGKHRYRVIDILGKGGVGITYRAVSLNSSQEVALKVVSLRQARDWKVLELFEREAKVLSCLDHQFIPAYLDYFELETENDKRFYLVQELIAGQSLADLVNNGWHGTEAEIRDIAAQILNILSYLHSFNPPIIHRDLKPHNIIRRPDGKVYLVDFGAVQDIYRNTVSLGKTFVGTLGYMPLEQLRGEVYPASDLYSLGCTLLFLLAHKSPADLPQKGLSIDFGNRVNISASFHTWLTQILEPIAEDRFQSAAAAKQALQGRLQANPSLKLKLPTDSKIAIAKTADNLQLKIPIGVHLKIPAGVHHSQPLHEPSLAKIATVFCGFIILPEVTMGLLLLWFVSWLSTTNKPKKQKASPPVTSVEKYIALEINAKTICLERSIGLDRSGNLQTERQELPSANFMGANTVGGEGTKDYVTIVFWRSHRDRTTCHYSFGQGHLDRAEARWIAQEVTDFIDRLRN